MKFSSIQGIIDLGDSEKNISVDGTIESSIAFGKATVIAVAKDNYGIHISSSFSTQKFSGERMYTSSG